MSRSVRIPRRLLVALILVASIFLVYGQTGDHPFIAFDDGDYLFKNDPVRKGVTPEGVAWAFSTFHTGNWHPLTWISHMLDVSLFGMNAGMHHRVNVFFHAANAILLFLFLVRMTGGLWRSAFTAILFAIHPLHVESVAWISERKDLLCAFFFLLSLLAYERYARRGGTVRYLSVVALFILSLLSKPMAVTLPFVLLLLDFWPLARISHQRPAAPVRVLLLEKIPFLLIAAASGVVTVLAQSAGDLVISLKDIPLQWRIANTLTAYAGYLGRTVWPASLAFFYPHPEGDLPFWSIGISALVLALFSILAAKEWKRRPYLAVGWFWYLGMLLPVIGLVQVGGQAMADRYTYLPLIGLFLIFAWGGEELAQRLKVVRSAAAAAVLILCVLAWVAWITAGYWESTLTLYSRSLKVTERNYMMHYNLGTFLHGEGRDREALAHFREALAISPPFPEADNFIGIILQNEGKTDEAIAHFREALRTKPGIAGVWMNLASALASRGETKEAARCFETALRIRPGAPATRNSYGIFLEAAGRSDEAIAQLREAIRLKPDYADPYYNLGAILVRRGKFAEATDLLRSAVRFDPDDPHGHTTLAVSLMRTGRFEEAIGHFREALRLSPGFVEARDGLDKALAQHPRVNDSSPSITPR